MDIIIELIITAVIVFAVYIFLRGFFERKGHAIWLDIILYSIYGLGLFLLGRYPDISFVRLVYNIIFPIMLALFLFKAKPLPALYSGISLSAVFILSEIILTTIMTIVGIDINIVMSHTAVRYVCSILSQLISLMLAIIILAVTKRKRTAITWPFILMLSPGAILAIWLGCELGRFATLELTVPSFPFLLAAVGLTYMNILLIVYAERVKEASLRQREEAIAEHHYIMQEEYYDQLRLEQNETRAIVHDIRKYFLAMKALVDKKQLDEASQVLSEVENLISDIGNTIDVGNPLISVILNQYKSEAEEEGICFDFDVSVPSELSVSAADAYILLGNTLDNAIEACASVPVGERYINIQLKQHHDILFYSVENPYSEEYIKRVRGKMHGYGLKSVQKCVDKYQGDMTVSKDHMVFTISARLNLGVVCSEEQVHNKAAAENTL